ncbi:transposase [Rhodococcus wratislaviensis IFP 2016]|nr:transposase [Rhodococcus wratislaviensis IFP 2016]
MAVARLAEQLKVEAAQIRSYGRRAQTRTEHLRLVAQYLGWRPAGGLELKEFGEFLLARAMEHDSPTLLFRLACEYLVSARVIRPGPVTVVERVAHARKQAQEETYDRLAHEFAPERCAELDGLLVTDPSIGMSRLRWLSTGPVEASAVKAEVAKLGFLRGLAADSLDMSVLPAERRRFLATMGRRLTGPGLERRDPQRSRQPSPRIGSLNASHHRITSAASCPSSSHPSGACTSSSCASCPSCSFPSFSPPFLVPVPGCGRWPQQENCVIRSGYFALVQHPWLVHLPAIIEAGHHS